MKQKTKRQRKARKMKKFRSQILAYWINNTFEPVKTADVGGGKGVLSYLLQKEGWDVTVIDPEYQELPLKYTDLNKKRIKIPLEEKVKRITAPFTYEMVKDYDLLIGLHAHGVNMNIIKGCAEFNKEFILLPCCVIDEPIEKQPDINWRESLYDYALSLGLPVKKVQFNFMGKNIAIYTDKNLQYKRINKNEEGMRIKEEIKKYLIEPIRYEPELDNQINYKH